MKVASSCAPKLRTEVTSELQPSRHIDDVRWVGKVHMVQVLAKATRLACSAAAKRGLASIEVPDPARTLSLLSFGLDMPPSSG